MPDYKLFLKLETPLTKRVSALLSRILSMEQELGLIQEMVVTSPRALTDEEKSRLFQETVCLSEGVIGRVERIEEIPEPEARGQARGGGHPPGPGT